MPTLYIVNGVKYFYISREKSNSAKFCTNTCANNIATVAWRSNYAHG